MPQTPPRSPAKTAAWFLALCIVGLALFHLLSTWLTDRAPLEAVVRDDLLTYRLRFRMFSLDREMAVPAWFSSVLMLINGGLFLMLAYVRKQKKIGNVLAWSTMGLVFIALSIDESVAIHEVLPQRMRELLGEHATGLLYYAWYLPFLAAISVLIWFWIPAWWRLPAAIRWGMAGSIAVFLSGAVAIEAVMGKTMESYGLNDPPVQFAPWSVKLLIMAEELVELVGIAILATTLIAHLSPQLKLSVVSQHEPGEAPPPPEAPPEPSPSR